MVNGFYSDSDPESPALTVYKIRTNDEANNAADKLFEYFNNRIRLFLRILTPVENTFKLVKIYFNMHFRVSQEAQITSLLPLVTINDVTKVFFTISEFTTWDQIIKSQLAYVPTEHLVDEYKNAYLGFKLQEALKCRILLMILDENIDDLNHYMRLLYAPSETLYNLAESVNIIYQLLCDYSQVELNRTTYKKISMANINEFYKLVSEEVEVAILDNHNITCEGNQVKIMNHLFEINKYLPTIEGLEFPENIEVIDVIKTKVKNIENDLKVMSNIAILYASDYLKNVYKINLYDNPLKIE